MEKLTSDTDWYKNDVTAFFGVSDKHSVMINDESEGVVLTRFLDACFKPDMGMMAHLPRYAHNPAIAIPDHHAFNHRIERVEKKDESINAFVLDQMIKVENMISRSGWGSAIRAFDDCWKDPIILHKEKNDTMFTLRTKLMKFYKKHGLVFEQKKFNKEVQELNVKKNLMMFI